MTTPGSGSPARRPGILIVDDTPANLELLAGMLQQRGYEPRPVLSGRRALSAARTDPPDLILLDVRMPEMSGLEVCAELKADAALRDIPVIFITALAETEDKVKAFALGAVDYVTKPFQLEEVLARVNVHLELRRQQRALEEANGELARLEQRRDSLVHMLVHDLRSPLQAVLGGLELARMDHAPQEPEDYMLEVERSVRGLVDMVSCVLDVSRLESEQMPLERTAVDVIALAHATVRKLESLRGRRTIAVEAPAALPPTAADARLLSRILQNLLANALKFTDPRHGVITIRIDAVPDGIRTTVADNGPGIAAEFRERVFDKFKQVEARQQGHVLSSGLGLTFCKLAVEAHGGRIGLESELGQGSAFWFELLW